MQTDQNVTTLTSNKSAYKMDRTFYKLNIGGIVYLVDPVTTKAYTYDLEDPTELGHIVWTDPKEDPKIVLKADWKAVLAAKLDKIKITTV